MKRIAITNGDGKWFDADKAEIYKEKSYWDGSNNLSKATGSQWEHEKIYITSGGVYVLNHWSNQGRVETYKIISKNESAKWFTKQGFSDEEIPEIFKENIYALEVK